VEKGLSGGFGEQIVNLANSSPLPGVAGVYCGFS